MIVSNNKGITLIALVITIVVLLILASIGIGGAITGVDESTDQKLKSELKMVQHAVLQRYTKYSLTKDECQSLSLWERWRSAGCGGEGEDAKG